MEESIAILISAHLLGDFLLQPSWLVRQKSKLPHMLLHGLVHAILAYALYQSFDCWQLPLLIFTTHIIIDTVKQQVERDTPKAFAWDQGSHILSLIGIVWLLAGTDWIPYYSGCGYGIIVGFAGFIASVMGAGHFVAKVMERVKQGNDLKIDGLENGGALIGILERALIFFLIFIGQAAGIGFLVAAKSILRFEEAKKQRLAEYVLIGTLLSFSLAIALASATKWAMNL